MIKLCSFLFCKSTYVQNESAMLLSLNQLTADASLGGGGGGRYSIKKERKQIAHLKMGSTMTGDENDLNIYTQIYLHRSTMQQRHYIHIHLHYVRIHSFSLKKNRIIHAINMIFTSQCVRDLMYSTSFSRSGSISVKVDEHAEYHSNSTQ